MLIDFYFYPAAYAVACNDRRTAYTALIERRAVKTAMTC